MEDNSIVIFLLLIEKLTYSQYGNKIYYKCDSIWSDLVVPE